MPSVRSSAAAVAKPVADQARSRPSASAEESEDGGSDHDRALGAVTARWRPRRFIDADVVDAARGELAARKL